MTGWGRHDLARRVANDVPDASFVNLGIGIPLLIPRYLPPGREVMFHSENGLLGLGGVPDSDAIDYDITNAAKEYATLVPGSSAFDSAMSFGIVRGGHLDLAVLGGMQVTATGDLANWTAPGRTPGVGGAMDLVQGAKAVWVVMAHTDKRGESKFVNTCTLPITGVAVVHRVYTPLGVFVPAGEHVVAIDLAPDVTRDRVVQSTAVPVKFDLRDDSGEPQ